VSVQQAVVKSWEVRYDSFGRAVVFSSHAREQAAWWRALDIRKQFDNVRIVAIVGEP
jgi:hypothetical protein